MLTALTNMPVADVSRFFDHNLSYQYIDMLDWPVQYPYKPDCRFKIARTNEKIYIKYYVKEKHIRAMYAKDHDPVWKDSCVEFFCSLPGQNFYYNFEFNCIGACLAARREGRTKNVTPLGPEQMKQIERFASLGREPFEQKDGYFEWELTVAIPLNIIGAEKTDTLNANFYKCGDDTHDSHYLSWNLIRTETPDFHRPDFFGKLILK